MSFKARLAKMQAQAEEASQDYKPGGNFTPIPDDDYLFKVKATFDETNKEPKRLQVTWCFVVADGEYEGRQVWDRTIIEDNKVGMNICHSRIDDLGYQWPEQIVDLEAIIEDITTRCPSITARVRSKENEQGYMNTRIYIREAHDLPNGETPTTIEETAETPEESTAAEQEALAESAPDNQALLDFCASQGLEGMTTDMTNEAIIAGLREGGCTFALPTLGQEEIDLLEANGGEDLIIRKDPALVKKAAPAPIKKAAPVSVTKGTKFASKKGKK
jgi:hypothetical protein